MSLQFVFGPSGAGKSRQLYTELIRRADENPTQNFLIIVPDQFTMQTQKELVDLSARGGILNIDVLSFGRLSHRILEEVGGADLPVLDDTGKSLVLQKVASKMKEKLPVLGSFLHRQGYIHEVKSAISEFMQYGFSVDDVSKLIDYAGRRGALVQKLRDLQQLYQGFLEYIKGNFITTEETMDVLCRSLQKSRILPGSVIVFDGFTGFTPIQNRVIQELMTICDEVTLVLTMGEEEDPFAPYGEQNLFALSKKTTADMCRLAKEAGVPRGRDIYVKHYKEEETALRHLERNLFRYQTTKYELPTDEIRLFETTTPRDEVHQTGLEIHRLVHEEGFAFRDIAIITGNLESYAPYLENEFAQMEIPVYVDRTRGIVLNPFLEFVKSAIELFRKNFDYPSVFHYLRSGLAGFTMEEVDLLENYCIATGVRGYTQYSRLFTKKPAAWAGDEEKLQAVNALRERLIRQVDMLHMGKQERVADYVDRLYDFLVENEVQQQLHTLETEFERDGDAVKAREYAQIYRLVIGLLEQVMQLLGEETITLDEFADILEAGFGEIEVGTIPQNVDRVLAGDMERTRLKPVKVLFFLGVNDGNIPKNASKGGIISDMDREFLRGSDLELAPSPRQQMYIQRLYLYLNMTKPTKRLYVGYSKVNASGATMRPAYLVDTLKTLFPTLVVTYPQTMSALEQIVTATEGAGILAEGLREYASGTMPVEKEKELFTIYEAYADEKVRAKRDLLTQAAWKRYEDSGLAAAVARALYGTHLENSVTRLETFAQCAYRHFLQYGLGLKERDEFGFETVDMGNIYHAILEQFAGKLAENNLTWFDFNEAFATRTIRETLAAYAATYGETVLYSSARNEYAITRMGRILTRTVMTLQEQLRHGSFKPDAYELSFRYADTLESVSVALSKEEKMRLQGRIDRIDIATDDEHIYVKVIDYKSGKKDFSLAALYYGLQLQLVVYMNAAMEYERKKHPDKEIVPAALLYYRVTDPEVEALTELSDEEIDKKILRELRMAGAVNSDPYIVNKLDADLVGHSEILPIEKNKDGSISARSSVYDRTDLDTISSYVSKKIVEIGREILDGKISLNPYEIGNENACEWCPYKHVCGFEPHLPGCKRRSLEKLNKETAFEKMREKLEGAQEV